MVEASWIVMAHAQKPYFFFRRNGGVHLNGRGRQFSRLLAAEVCASAFIVGSNAGYTMFRGSVKGTGYTPHSPVSPSLTLPCVTVCHHIWTGVYLKFGSSFGKNISPVWQNISFKLTPSSINELAILDHLNHTQIKYTNKYLHQCGIYSYVSLTTGIRSEKCVVMRFRLCANVYLHKPR